MLRCGLSLFAASLGTLLLIAPTALAAGPPSIDETFATNVSSTSADLGAQLNPHGAATTYHFEYVTQAQFEESEFAAATSTPESASIGSDSADHPASAHLTGLAPQTAYRYRVIATNSSSPAEGTPGPARAITTQAAGATSALPDGREWELVSPPLKSGAYVLPLQEGGGIARAAEDGSAVTYLTSAPTEAEPQGSAQETQVLSRRGAGGWTSQDISPLHDAPTGLSIGHGQEYRFFSPDLSKSIVEPFGPGTPLSPEATERTIYLRDNATGAYLPLVTAANVPEGTKFGGNPENLAGDVLFKDATPDLSHVVLTSSVGLTSTPIGGALYEWTAGQLQPITVLPQGEGGALVGGSLAYQLVVRTAEGDSARDYENAISTDGSRIIWLAGERFGEHIYLRDLTKGANGETIRLDAGLGQGEPHYITANSDASKVYFTEGDLYEFALETGSEELSGTLTDLTTQGRGVPPTGRYQALMSSASLTGYNNVDARSGARDEEVYLYDTATERLVCASCDPTGARPLGIFDTSEGHTSAPLVDQPREWNGAWLAGSIPGGTRVESEVFNFTSRYLDPATGRLFFNSPDALVPQDTNGTEDVYQYEPEGLGSCTRAGSTFSEASGGCLSLVSSGTSPEESAFLDASAGGNDVFFLTAAQLTRQDLDTSYDVYDAHVCAPSAPCPESAVATPPCDTGESCKPAPTAPPASFGGSASETLSGQGNAAPGPASHSLSRAQRLARALRACRSKANRAARAACERRAEKRYGAKRSSHRAAGRGGRR